MIQKLRYLLNKGGERSEKAKKNILKMLVYRGGNVLIGLLLVPMTLDYVSDATYGIWLTISSIVVWLNFFDVGLNNGLRNRLTEAIARGDVAHCKKLVSTTYAILTLITIPLVVILLGLVPIVDWGALLNLNASEIEGFVPSLCIVIVYFGINFVINTINVVMYADQRPADVALRTFIQQLVALVIIYILTLTTKGSLLILCVTLCFAPLAVCLLFNFTLFRGRYRKYAPSLEAVDFKIAPDMMKLSGKFFIIQLAGVVQFQLINFIILRYFGATEVTSYNIAFKYFNVLVMVWGIVVAPIWNAVADAAAKREFDWVDRMLRKYIVAFVIFTVLGLAMLALSNTAYYIWVGDKVEVPLVLSLWVYLYSLSQMFSQLYVNIINGTGKLTVQAIACLFSPLVFIGVCWIGIANGYGISAIMLAAIVCNFNGLILAPVQCYRMLKNRKV